MICKYKGGKNKIMQIKASFSEDGEYIICGSEIGNIFIWRTNGWNSCSASGQKANRATVGSGFLSFGKRKDRDANYYSFLPSDGDMRKQSDPQSHQSAAITAALFAPTGTVHNILKRFSVQKDVIDFLSSSEGILNKI